MPCHLKPKRSNSKRWITGLDVTVAITEWFVVKQFCIYVFACPYRLTLAYLKVRQSCLSRIPTDYLLEEGEARGALEAQ